MSAALLATPAHGRVDRDGRLIEADAMLLELQVRAGGEAGGTIAVPQIATLARLAQRLGILISRAVVAADGERDLDLWVRAQPEAGQVRLTIGGWQPRPVPVAVRDPRRENDFLRASADWLWEVDETLKIVALSAAAERAIGSGTSPMIGRPLTQLLRLIEDAEGALPLLDALAARRGFERQDAELRGGAARLTLSAVPLVDADGAFKGFRGSAIWAEISPTDDAPPLAIADAFGERLDRALREPLARIVDRAETIAAQGDGPLRRDYADYAGDIANAGRHLLALVDDLVDLQAIERPGFVTLDEPVDVADVARRAAGLLAARAAEREIRIDRPALDEALPARGDVKRIFQILVNLIGNAVRYSPPGGMVWLRGEIDEHRVSLTIADQGKGIAAEHHERIFEKFERIDTGEPGGSGLGLYIARQLARAMGGEITVDSAPGQGARFTLTLPGG